MRLFHLTYTENKSDVVAPPDCLFIVDLWVLSGYLFVLYIKSPFYSQIIERMNADRMVRLLNKYEEMGREAERKRKILEEIEKEVEGQTDNIIKNKKHGDNRKRLRESRKRTNRFKKEISRRKRKSGLS